MRKGMRTIVSAGGAAVLLMGLAATSAAAAAPRWTVSPGGTFAGKQSGPFKLTDTVTGKSVSCDDTSTGSLKAGKHPRGAGIGSLTGVSFASCTGAGRALTVTAGNLPWSLNAVSFNPNITAGTTTGTVTGMHVTLAGKTCHATVDGSSATANDGQTDIHFHNSLSKLKIRTEGSNLHVYNVTGCTGVFNSGDAVTFSSAYVVSPAQTITLVAS